jgi:hypothetical protein
VPSGVTSVTIQAFGAQGREVTTTGDGASITATIPVTPGETLFVYVGGQGGDPTFAPPGPGNGGGGNVDGPGWEGGYPDGLSLTGAGGSGTQTSGGVGGPAWYGGNPGTA